MMNLYLQRLNEVLLTIFVLCTCVTVGSNTSSSSDYVSWQSEGNDRGTWSLLVSSASTLFLCVYTALHLDVPLKGTTKRAGIQRTVSWIITAIFVPEIPVMVALADWIEARSLTRLVAELRDRNTATRSKTIDEWTIQHSYFANMHGLQIDLSACSALGKGADEGQNLVEPDVVILTGQAVFRLLEAGLEFPDMTRQEIRDRSKADYVTKAVAFIQVTWYALQIVARAVTHLPVSGVEITVIAHTFCALIAYLFWFPKPYSVHEPMMVHPRSSAEQFLASLYLYQLLPNHWLDRETTLVINDRELSSKTDVLPDSVKTILLLNTLESSRNTLEISSPLSAKLKISPRELVHIQAARACTDMQLHLNTEAVNVVARDHNSFHATSMTLHGWIVRALQEHHEYSGNSQNDHIHVSISKDSIIPAEELDDLPSWNRQTWVYKEGQFLERAVPLQAVLFGLFIDVVYGGIHLALWDAHFPTSTERWIWRGASILACTQGIIALLVASLLRIIKGSFSHGHATDVRLRSLFYDIIDYTVPTVWLRPSLKFLAGVFEGIFVLGRIYLMLEALISLRSEPVMLYQEPVWTNWLPHL